MRTLLTAALVGFLIWGLSAQCPPSAAAETSYTTEQLQEMVAPLALYPDNLLMQILMASTYPIEIVEAERWVAAHPGLNEQQRANLLQSMTWDPSVTSLTAFPAILSQLSQNLEWTDALGEAFLGQRPAVLQAIQVMRRRAYDSGNLVTTAQLKVVVWPKNIIITPASPQVVYVPAYNPTVVYGPAWVHPAWLWPGVMVAPVGFVGGVGISFGVGFAVGPCMFGACNWVTGRVWLGPGYSRWPGYAGGVAFNRSVYVNNGNMFIHNGNTFNGESAQERAAARARADQERGAARHKADQERGAARHKADQEKGAATARSDKDRGAAKARSDREKNNAWRYKNDHRGGTNFRNPGLQHRFNAPNNLERGHVPAHPTTFNGDRRGDNRASARGARSSGRPGAGFHSARPTNRRPVVRRGGGGRHVGGGGKRR